MTCATLAAGVLIASSAAAQMPDARQMSGIPQARSPARHRHRHRSRRPRLLCQSRRQPDRRPRRRRVAEAGDHERRGTRRVHRSRTGHAGQGVGGRGGREARVAGVPDAGERRRSPGAGRRRSLRARPRARRQPLQPPAGPAQPGDVVLGDRLPVRLRDGGRRPERLLRAADPQRRQVAGATREAAGVRAARRRPRRRTSRRLVTAGDDLGPPRRDFRAVSSRATRSSRFAYTFPFGDAKIDDRAEVPVRLMHVAVVAEKAGEMQLSSPQVGEQQRCRPTARSTSRAAARRSTPTDPHVHVNRVPHHSTWPRDIALALALLILAGGAVVGDAWRWQAGRRPGSAAGRSRPGATSCSTSSPPWKARSGGRPSIPKSSPGAGASW